MALLELLAMAGAFAYGVHAVKNDIRAEKTDLRVTPSVDDRTNERTIQTYFVDICKRSGVTLNENRPVYLEDLHLGMEYLQYKGFNPKSVKYFKELYTQKFKQLAFMQYTEISKKHNQILNSYTGGNTIVTFKHDYYGTERPQPRMDKLYSYPLWNKLVDNYTYIRGQHSNAKFTEIWNLKINSGFLTLKEIKQIYKEICWINESYNEIKPKTPSNTHSTNNKKIKTGRLRIKPSNSIENNRNLIQKNFIDICIESGIELNNNKPINPMDCKLGIKYLEERGFNYLSTTYFSSLFNEEYNKFKNESIPPKQTKDELIEKHENIIKKYNLDDKGTTLFTHEYYGEGIFPRETALRSYPAWNKLVYDFSSSCDNPDVHWTEKWILKIKPEEYNEEEIEQLYTEICYILDIGL